MAIDVTAPEALAALGSQRWTAIRDAVESVADLLRSNTLEPTLIEQFGGKLVALASHPKWEVRKSVAETLQYLRHERYYAVLQQLSGDDHAFVCEAARRSLTRRTALLHGDSVAEQRGDLLETWLDELQVAYGGSARAAAWRIAEKYTGRIVREARHEIVRVLSPLEAALAGLQRELEKQDVDREACRTHLMRALGRTHMLDGIVKSLTDYTTAVTPQFEDEKLHEIIEEAVSIAKHNVTNRRIEVDVTCASDLHLMGDRHRLLQALSNIIQNAIEAYPAEGSGTVEIIAHRTESREVVLRIVDRGSGMSDEVCRDAVLLYSTNKPEGTGFGLPLAKKIIETEHRGALGLASTKDKGTTVTLVLPMEQG